MKKFISGLIISLVFVSVAYGAADIQRGKTFAADASVENTDLHSLVDDATISDIDQTDMAANYGLVFRSGSQPSDTDTLWYDTGNTTLKVYDGSSYVAVPDDEPTFTSVTAPTITSTGDLIGVDLSASTNLSVSSINSQVFDNQRLVTGWAVVNNGGTTSGAYNVTSITDTGTGDYLITWATDFADTNYAVVLTPAQTNVIAYVGTKAAGTTQILQIKRSDGTPIDGTVNVIATGTQ